MLFPSFAAAFMFAKYSGILACVSKLSMVLKFLTNSGPITGRSVAEPPQRIITSTSPFKESTSSMCTFFTPSVKTFTVSGLRRVTTATNSMSSLRSIASSTPRPILPYPTIPILILLIIISPFISPCGSNPKRSPPLPALVFLVS